MPRITVELSVEEHRSLKLLTILEGKKLGDVLKEAINSYLVQNGAHDLEVKGKQLFQLGVSGVPAARRSSTS